MASTSGLIRYDGYEKEKFSFQQDSQNRVLYGDINAIATDQLGRLWVAGSQGLARFDADTERFINYTALNSPLVDGHITALTQGNNGTLLLTDQRGLYRYTVVDDTIERLDTPQSNFPQFQINVLYQDNEKIWMGTVGNGVFAFNPDDQQIYNLANENPWNMKLPVKSLITMEQYAGSYWLGTDKGLFEVFDGNRVRDVFGDADRPDLKELIIRDIKLNNGLLWVGTSSGLLSINSEKLIEQTLLTVGQGEERSMANYVYSLHVDPYDVLWIGTWEGVYRKLPIQPRAPTLLSSFYKNGTRHKFENIWSIAPLSDGRVWATGEQDKIYLIDKSAENTSIYQGLTQSSIWDLAVDFTGAVWLGTSNGIFQYRLDQQNKLALNAHLFKGSLIDSMLETERYLWFWHNKNEIVKLNVATQQTTFISSPEGVSTAIPVAEDDLGRVWFNTNAGTMIFEPNTQVFSFPFADDAQHPMHSILITSFYSHAGHYYVVTDVNGIFKLEKQSLVVDDRKASSKSTVMAAVGVGSSIWYADSKSIQEITLPRMDRGEFIPSNALQNNEYFEWSAAAGPDNMLYFGGASGISRFSPNFLYEQNASQTVPPAPKILEFTLFNSAIDFDDKSTTILDKPIYLTDSIYLENQENRFGFKFGVVNPLAKEQIEYRHRLLGLDETWNNSKNERSETYNSLLFGNYVFEVQARTPDSGWSDSTRLNITIAPPLWLHKHALIFYAFFLALATIYFIRQYQARKASQLAIQESEERLKLTLWSSGDELWDWDIYAGQVHRSNMWGTLDFPQDDIRTNSAYEANIHPSDIERVKNAIQEHLDGNSEYYETAFRAKTYKGEWLWLLDRGKVVKRDQHNKPLRMTGTLKNIQHLKQAEEQLYLFKRSIENISEGVFITNTEFRFVSVNNAYCKYTGETREKALASYLFFHQYPDAFTQEIKKSLRQKGNWSGEVESLRSNGVKFEMELNIDAVYGDDSKISHYVGVFSDITSRKNTEKELLKLANVDPLTDLPNRSFFQASHQNLVRKDVPHTLMCLDMDNFKKINDSLGHQTGDILIKQIARRVQRVVGSVATCYRLGGDEFSLLLENRADVHTITHFAQNVLDTLSRPFVINKQEFVLSASLGIAFYPDDGATPQELLKNADTAMYFAKNSGGNSYQFFSGEMNQNAVRQLQIENLIRQGLRDNLFTVFYQPKVDITSGKLVSMEALVRFEHPQKGIVSPSQFIPLAEQTGQIIEIGEQVLRKACEDTKRWVNAGLFAGRVAVNISAKQFELPDLDDRIDKTLRQVGLSPLHLECELTEGTLMENPDQGLKLMQRLRERGIHLALDDFGTGYSSLAYLKKFPLNTLKIDKAFIDDIAVSSVDRHMAAAIINIAHNLGLKVVAEGVEHENQLSILRRYDCEMLQGYLYSKPLNADKFEKLLRENQKLHQLIGESNLP
ncbi:EAL domain-containing protein [Alteromonas sp. SM 2104]|nr:EAL domain-containing protein [Alteromonas oceanisediminis]